jgi:hypothetical protein
VADSLGLPLYVLSKIVLPKEKLTNAEFNCRAQAKLRKNMKVGAYDELEKVLPEWFQQMHSYKYIPISGPILREKVNHIAFSLNIVNFKASNGCLYRFKLRHDVGYRVGVEKVGE